MLDKVALFVIFFLAIIFAALIVWIGSIPGKIARGRNHPAADAVNAAAWIGVFTGLWPLAFIWAFLPVPAKPTDASTDLPESGDDGEPGGNLADLQKRLTVLEATIKDLSSQPKESAK